MPIHAYHCKKCGTNFDQYKEMHTEVSFTKCINCEYVAQKSWAARDVGVAKTFEPYYEEQLNCWISSRRGLKHAMKSIEEKTEGKVKVEWQ